MVKNKTVVKESVNILQCSVSWVYVLSPGFYSCLPPILSYITIFQILLVILGCELSFKSLPFPTQPYVDSFERTLKSCSGVRTSYIPQYRAFVCLRDGYPNSLFEKKGESGHSFVSRKIITFYQNSPTQLLIVVNAFSVVFN